VAAVVVAVGVSALVPGASVVESVRAVSHSTRPRNNHDGSGSGTAVNIMARPALARSLI